MTEKARERRSGADEKRRLDTTVLSQRRIALSYHELRFSWPEDLVPAPGSFVTLRSGGRYDPLLRRPFAFSGFEPEPGAASVIFQKRGRGTEYLASLRPGDSLDALGPLGKGFSRPGRGLRPLLVAGGIGLGPMLYLARSLFKDAKAGLTEAPILVIGLRNAALVPDTTLPPGTVICSDDGSAGFHGSSVDWLAGHQSDLSLALYACGPAPMMAALDRFAEARRLDYQAATEQWMACGVGACAGCALKLKSGAYIRVCADGPVVDGRQVDWEAAC